MRTRPSRVLTTLFAAAALAVAALPHPALAQGTRTTVQYNGDNDPFNEPDVSAVENSENPANPLRFENVYIVNPVAVPNGSRMIISTQQDPILTFLLTLDNRSDLAPLYGFDKNPFAWESLTLQINRPDGFLPKDLKFVQAPDALFNPFSSTTTGQRWFRDFTISEDGSALTFSNFTPGLGPVPFGDGDPQSDPGATELVLAFQLLAPAEATFSVDIIARGSAIPEPGTFALALAGGVPVALLNLWRRRRRSQRAHAAGRVGPGTSGHADVRRD